MFALHSSKTYICTMFKGNVLCSLFHGQRLAENRRLNPQKQVSGKDNDSSDDGLEEYDMDVAPSTSGRGSGRGKGKKRGSSTNQSSSTGRGSRGGRGRGRGRGSKSTSSASTNRQSMLFTLTTDARVLGCAHGCAKWDMLLVYSGTSDSGLSQVWTLYNHRPSKLPSLEGLWYNKPPSKGQNLRSQYNSYNMF